MSASDPLTWIFVVVVCVAGALALIAVRGHASLGVRSGSLVLAAVLMASSYGGLIELMARPKPVSLEWVRGNAETAKVAGSVLRENEAIYLWLTFKDNPEPRAYQLPWDTQMARQLRKAQQNAEKRKSEVEMRMPFRNQRSVQEQVFHAPPRPSPPPKNPNAS